MAAAGGMPWAIAVALWWLLPALTTERYAGKRPARHFKRFKGLKPVKRQPWTPIRSHCCGRGDALSHCCGLAVAFACGRGACWACWGTVCLRSWAFCMREWRVLGLLGYLFPAELGGLVEGLERLERLRREWRVLGLLGYLLPAELGGLLEGLERLERRGACWACWGTFCLRSWAFCMRGCAELGRRLEGLRPVKRQPGTPIRSHCCGRGDALSHCCGLVVASACGRGACWACWGTVCLRSWAFCMRRHKAWWKLPPGSCREAPEAWTP